MKYSLLNLILVLGSLSSTATTHAQTPQANIAAPKSQEQNHQCTYRADGGGSCTVFVSTCANQKQCILEFEGHWVALTAAHQTLVPVQKTSETLNGQAKTVAEGTMLPLSPKIESDLKIEGAGIIGMVGSTTPTLSDYDAYKRKFQKCKMSNSKDSSHQSLHLEKSEQLFVDNKCPFSVVKVELQLPPGTRPAEGLVQGAMSASGRDLKEAIDATNKNLEFLAQVLPMKRRPLANAFREAVDELSLILHQPESRYVNHFRVMEGARNLYVHASTLEAMLERNKNPLTEKYIQQVSSSLSQIIPAFGFNDKVGKDTPIPTGYLSKGYIALLTGLDVALQDLIVGLPLDSLSAELRAIYDMQSFVQKVKSNSTKSDNELAAAVSRLQGQWNDKPFQNILNTLYGNAREKTQMQAQANPEAAPSTCSAVKRYPMLSLLVSLGESLESFSDEEFLFPFQMDCVKR